ncbi:MAG: lamin tail domain-containing protein, partial [Planctomycetes bacterium]|nr:lamin tail domain-containing protein [Planctomycetota bacterium]
MRSAVDIDGVLAAGRIPVVFPAAVVLSVVLILLAGSPSAAGDLVLNELLAVGGDLADEDGDFSDWIEIHNRGASAVELDGWYLTDDAADLRKWRFPPVTLSAGGYLVVFASDKDRAEAGEELHTSFRLSSTGEYLALVMPDGASLVDAFAPAYPEQYDDVSFGIEQAVQGEVLIGAESPARYLVPAGGEPDGWADRGFDD